MTRLRTTLIAFAGLSLMAAPTALAAQAETVSVEVDTRYLETDWGVEIIYDKLSKKAETACASGSVRGLKEMRLEENCATTLLESFVKNTGHEALSDYHTKMQS